MSLQSHETKDLLDIVDNLRSRGINRCINLPEIIVCGEQSSGKSSVLEAVSGVKFPSKDNLCTRFATELILRRGPEAPIKMSIVPGSRERDRSDSDLEKLRNFHYSRSLEGFDLGPVIEEAKDAMGIGEGSSKVFSSDILRLELSGPEQPHLTLVDLPGLSQAGSRTQSDDDVETVRSLVLSYMKNPHSIILAVVSAKSDLNLQSITKDVLDIDPRGKRTLGLITKPDTLDEGSDSERSYFELAQNRGVRFRLGWHVLRNRDYTSMDSNTEERDQVEKLFFETGIWRSLPSELAGVDTLKPRLGKILEDHIVAQLPEVLTQIRDGIEELKILEERLGAVQNVRDMSLLPEDASDPFLQFRKYLEREDHESEQGTESGHRTSMLSNISEPAEAPTQGESVAPWYASYSKDKYFPIDTTSDPSQWKFTGPAYVPKKKGKATRGPLYV
ncbi:uncharacterized protein J4E79_011501 [Alternaria viburni]|uniref:uncharacterized protein n=1 Tax=Alternaria viburni TaxID=566460 RepID=UPI0020C2DA2F|nr:uncharacterized protein J4E79_011501 [Alternaria viburni]KAI4642439.1 hypothetical protein J4E79_011501 [Alternaria viburni]